jgi:hypothetical protein
MTIIERLCLSLYGGFSTYAILYFSTNDFTINLSIKRKHVILSSSIYMMILIYNRRNE